MDRRRAGPRIAAITAPLDMFETDLASGLAAAGSWATDEGLAGSIIVVREGQVVVAVIATGAGAKELEDASHALAALVLDRLRSTDEPKIAALRTRCTDASVGSPVVGSGIWKGMMAMVGGRV